MHWALCQHQPCKNRFLNFFRNRREGKDLVYLADATPDYLADPVAAKLLGKLMPAAKLIVLVRDPARRAHAAWDQNRRAGSEGRTFKQAVEDEMPSAVRCRQLAVKLSQDPGNQGLTREYVESCALYVDGSPTNCWVNRKYDLKPACKRYLYKGFYSAHIGFWRQYFPSEQVLVVQSESLFKNQRGVLEQVEGFLGLAGRPSYLRRARQLLAANRAAKDQTCWHDCGKPKRSFDKDINRDLAQALDKLYAPMEAASEITKRDVRWIV